MRFFVFVFVFVFSLASAAFAQGEDDGVFIVSKVPVEAQADNATSAQRIAIAKGRRQAVDIVLRRLTAEEDWAYLPRMMIGEQALAGQPMTDAMLDDGTSYGSTDFLNFSAKSAVYLDPSQLPSLEEGFTVSDEKSSLRSYAAKVTYRFKPNEIRDLLKGARIPYSESQTRRALVLPILETQNGLYLWESNNPWARAWLARPLLNELTPILLPRGDERDMKAITAAQAKSFNPVRLRGLASRYGVTQVIIAHAYLSEIEGQYILRVRLMDGYLSSSARTVAAIDAANSDRLYDQDGGFGEDGVIETGSFSEQGQTLFEIFFKDQVGDFPLLASRAVELTVAKYAASWKAQTLIDHSVSRAYEVNAWFASIDEWAGIRRVLDASPLIERYETEALTADGASVTMRVVGDVEQLVIALRQNNIVFWSLDNFMWNIATNDTFERVKGQVRPVVFEQAPESERRGQFERFRRGAEVDSGTQQRGFGIFGRRDNRETRSVTNDLSEILGTETDASGAPDAILPGQSANELDELDALLGTDVDDLLSGDSLIVEDDELSDGIY